MPRNPLKNEIKPLKPHLTRGTGGLSAEVMDVRTDVGRCMDRIETEFPQKQSVSRLDLYINGTTGDDINDGSSAAQAVKSLPRLRALMPEYLDGDLVIHHRGSLLLGPEPPHTDITGAPFHVLPVNCVGTRNRLVWDGGMDRTAVLAPIVSDINTADTIGKTTATWTVNQWRGYWVEITSGVLAGLIFVVEKNSATTLTFLNNFTDTDPGVGATFRLIRPTTEITSAGPVAFSIVPSGQSCRVYFQNVFISGGVELDVLAGAGVQHMMVISHVLHDAPLAMLPFFCGVSKGIINMGNGYRDNLADLDSVAYGVAGFTQCSQTPIPALWEYSDGVFIAGDCVFPQFAAMYTNNAPQFYVSKVESLILLECKGGGTQIGGDAFWQPPGRTHAKFGGYRDIGVPTPTLPAVLGHNSSGAFLGSKMDDGTYGMEACNCAFTLKEVFGANALAGVWSHSGAKVWLTPGTVPTVTGNAGSVELTEDGTTQKSAWSAIAATPVVTPEVVCKEYAVTYWGF